MGLNKVAIERASRAVVQRAAVFEQSDELAKSSLSCPTKKRSNPTLFSNSHTKVPRFIIADAYPVTPPRRSAEAHS